MFNYYKSRKNVITTKRRKEKIHILQTLDWEEEEEVVEGQTKKKIEFKKCDEK